VPSAPWRSRRDRCLGQPDGVLRPDRRAPAGEARNGHDIAEPLRIALATLLRMAIFVLEDFSVSRSGPRLHGVEPPGQPETNIVVLVRALAVNADAAQRLREVGIVGENRSAVAKTAQRLGGKKARRGDKAEGAEAAAVVACADACAASSSTKIPSDSAIAPMRHGRRFAEQVDRITALASSRAF